MRQGVFRRYGSLLLSLTLALSAGLAVPALTGAARSGNPGVLFQASFEAGGSGMLESTPDGQRIKNVAYVPDAGRMPGDVTHLVRSDALSGAPDFKAEEGKQNLFDYNTGSKFLTGSKAASSAPVEVVLELEEERAVQSYLIASGNDEPGRDPAAWTFYGSADGQSWTALDAQKNISFSSRKESKTFSFDNETAYRHYRLSVTENKGAAMTQFAELQLSAKKQAAGAEELTGLVMLDTLSGSPDFVPAEGKDKLFDHNGSTKFLTGSKPTAAAPVEVSFQTQRAVTVASYSITSGPDETGRNPKAWTFYGSADGQSWQEIDRQAGQAMNREQETFSYTVQTPAAYAYYKLAVTENNGAPMTQFSEFHIFGPENGGTEEPGPADQPQSPMMTRKSRGPSSSFGSLTSTGWTGWSALEVKGRHTGEGEAYCYNVLYDGLSIPVTADTQLSYVFFPALHDPDVYDFEYTAQHMAVDLQFTDGSYLSELHALDQNGVEVGPMAQGEGGVLAYMQWNQIYSGIGGAAAGKTIEKILIGYHKADNQTGEDPVFLGYFDDIIIENKPQPVYDHLSDYVNILRGTNNDLTYSRGITTPLVHLPHGFNSFAPQTESNSTLPYFYQLAGSKTKLRHMSIEHVASPWLGDWGTWQFMPNTDIVYAEAAESADIGSDRRAASFTHEKEEAKAHYYSVTFEEGSAASGVRMEVTPTSHAMYSRFTFPAGSANRNLIFDCERADSGLAFAGDGSFTAYSDHVNGQGDYSPNRVNGATRMYIYGVFDQAYADAKVINGKQGIITFPAGTGKVTMKLATSYISAEQAKKNLELEIGTADFDGVFRQAQKTWDDQLGIIQVEGASFDQLTTLYSSMYRLFSYPILYSENAGDAQNEKWVYSNPYGGSLTAPQVMEGKMYTINGFWDTYRTAWPAYALFTPGMSGEMLDGLLEHYKVSGWVSRWIAPGAVNCMLGTHADAIFGDAMQKGIDFDYESALAASLKNSAVVTGNLDKGGRIETASSVFRGYTSNNVHEGYSWGIEDTVNDFNIYKMAEKLGYADEAAYYKNRAFSYAYYYNPDIGFFMGRNADGSFKYTAANAEQYDPTAWYDKSNYYYCESNGWNMSMSAVQDVQGMANLYGGAQAAIEHLDSLFAADLEGKQVGQREMREVRLGQYNPTNEPSLHLPYLYAYLGQPYKTQAIVRDVLARCYAGSGIGQGYLGDEDNGAMSAAYIFSALGFYPASVGTAEYIIGSPLFTKATVQLENGKKLVINAPENSRENIYIQSVKWNGKAHDKTYFTHEQLAAGGVVDFAMGPAPSDWGTAAGARPSSLTEGNDLPTPLADVTTAGMRTGSSIDKGSAVPMAASRQTAGLANLLDNTSDTAAVLSGSDKEIIYYNPAPKTVSLYTLTSTADPDKAPSAFTLYGSSDGRKWEELDSRSDISFQWGKYTRPFAVAAQKQGAYAYYKLAFADPSDVALAEIELIGDGGLLYPDQPVLTLSPSSLTLWPGENAQLTAQLRPAGAGTLQWSSSDPSVAEVDQEGRVTAEKAGTAEIRVTIEGHSGIEAVCRLTVTDRAGEIAEIRPVTVYTAAGTAPSLPATVEAVYSDGSTANLPVIWETPAPGQYAAPGVFTLTGAVAGCTLEAAIRIQVYLPGDLDGSGEVTIQDVMEACKVLARQSAGKAPAEEEMIRGDLNGDADFTISDVMEICKILARKA
ncbi:MAG: glycoside hydrolase family 92 protein [Clostridiales bacterium]|nr:glycoside hydrolase family 92 protein [Clostridiales bacterium]